MNANTFHVVADVPDNYSLRMRYLLPPFNLPTTTEGPARWVIVTKPICVHANMSLVKSLCDKYGAERLVLMDWGDQGDGEYPCTVFAQNCKHSWPKNVIGYIQPIHERRWLQGPAAGGVKLDAPYRKERRFTVSFCGDVSSHPCRRVGADIIATVPGHFLKLHPDGFNAKEMAHVPLDGDYNLSFDAQVMWCPPSRRALTMRLSEALAAGVPVLTTPLTPVIRLPPTLSFLDWVWCHDANMGDFTDVLQQMLAAPLQAERAAVTMQKEFAFYSENFWSFVSQELSKL